MPHSKEPRALQGREDVSSAVEAMAKALDDYASTLPETSAFRAFLRSHKHGAAKAALAALAEIELPVSALIAAEKVAEDCKGEEFMDVTFRAIVGALKEENGDPFGPRSHEQSR